MRRYKLKVELPYLIKGAIYAFEEESGQVFRCEDDGKPFQYPLRPGLSGYLWLLLTDRNKYFREVACRQPASS